MKFLACVAATFLTSMALCRSLADSGQILEVKAGDYARTNVPLSLTLTNDLPPFDLVDSDNPKAPRIPTQIQDHRLTFILPAIEAHTTKHLTIIPKRNAPKNGLHIAATQESLSILQGDRSRFSYALGQGTLPASNVPEIYRRAGFIHPLRTPSGQTITDSYATNHLHHHGVWFAWTKTEFAGRHPDFWNMGDGKGTVRLTGLSATWDSAVTAGFEADYEYIDMISRPEVVALREHWQITTYAAQPAANAYLIDLVATHEAEREPLALPLYHYGGLGFRGLESWNGSNHWAVLTSEGITNRIEANATRARWCYLGGDTPKGMAGITILCAPDNFRFPQPIRVHPTEPFFCYAPSQAGDWSIQPGQPYISRYRLVVMDGPPKAAQIEAWWRDFAFPPVVSMVSPKQPR